MKANRKELLAVLQVASVGVTRREVLEQSNSLIFTAEALVTFSGEIFTWVPTPLPEIAGAVPAEDVVALLAKFPDEGVDVTAADGELRIKGKKRAAGVTMDADVRLPYGDVPKPGKWRPLPPALLAGMVQAGRVCGKDEAQPRTTEVHVGPGYVEACDNFRLYRAAVETGIDEELLVPASSVHALGGVAFAEYAAAGGWLHLRTKAGHRVSVRCSAGKYPDLAPLLELKDAKKVELPENLADVLARVEVMQDYNAMAQVTIAEGEMFVKARKDGGWFSERRSIEYTGEPLRFEVNTKFLQEVLARTKVVRIGGNRMKIKSGDSVTVVCLEVPEEKK